MSEYVERFQNLLRELFQFDCADLDFGIYRIMNHKRDVIEKFIATDLPNAIAAELDRGALADQSQAAKELKEIAEQITQTLGKDALDADDDLAEVYHGTPLGKKYQDLRTKAAGGRGREALEASILNHLYTFFGRYYQDGDFISKRRYSKRQRYAVPYNGEEVHLYWANNDQYYVKTAEHFHDYSFTSRGVTVHFKLAAASVEQDNVKGDKRFFLPRTKEIDWKEDASELVIPFEYRPLTEQEEISYGTKSQQDKIIAEALEGIPKRLQKNEAALAALTAERRKTAEGEPVTYLEHHVRQYTRRNTSDFFIHKNLKGFLSRELDFYLKNEVLSLDEIEAGGEDRAEAWFQVMRVIKAIGGQIIDFLDQIESFQKMLWEKRKFITEAQYCITVGNIDEDFYPDIASCDPQWVEWKDLFHIDEEQTDLFNSGKGKRDKRIAFLKAHPTLTLDTKHFHPDLVDCLIGSFDDLDDVTDGLLLHSENFQALSLLLERYREKVKCVYIDPPYNTASNSIPYKNNYKHSSFASMMRDRVAASHSLLAPDGVIFVSIDKTERTVVEHTLDSVFGRDNRVEEIIWVMNTTNSQVPTYSTNHEYVLTYARNLTTVTQNPQMFREPKPGYEEIVALIQELEPLYPATVQVEEAIRALHKQHRDEYRNEIEDQGLDWKAEARNDPWRGIYPYCRVEYRGAEGQYVPEAEAQAARAMLWVWQEGDMSMPATKQSPTVYEPKNPNYRFYRPLHPITGKPCTIPKSGWKFRSEEFERLASDNRIAWGPDETKVPRIKRYLGETETNVAKSVVVDYSDGEKETSALFGRSGVFMAPKPTSLVSRFIRQTNRGDDPVIDYFAGSGTTGHAVIKSNREDSGGREFILAEMGQCFDSVLLPRIKKVTFAPDWKDGKPQRMPTAEETDRSPRIVKYIRLESYEDALNNIEFDDVSGQLAMQFDDYLLRYMLQWETRKSDTLLNVEQLASPFRYTLHIHEEGQTREKVVDIPETFNCLLGLHVQTRRVHQDGDRRYLVYSGRIDHREIVIIWRDTEGWQKADLERDKAFVVEQKLTEGAHEVFVNGDSFIPNAKALEPLFKARMFAPVEA
jgi:adenine-specific DNA-methyltransferase